MRKEPREPKKTIGVPFSYPKHNDIEARAKSLKISKGKYVAIVMDEWLASGKKLTMSE